MTTKAQLLAAAKKIIAEATKKNPAPRTGAKKPNRASQATGKAPTKRLVKRRKANKVEGYFPNPSEVKAVHSKSVYDAKKRIHRTVAVDKTMPYIVQRENKKLLTWEDLAAFATKDAAFQYARAVGRIEAATIRVICG